MSVAESPKKAMAVSPSRLHQERAEILAEVADGRVVVVVKDDELAGVVTEDGLIVPLQQAYGRPSVQRLLAEALENTAVFMTPQEISAALAARRTNGEVSPLQ